MKKTVVELFAGVGGFRVGLNNIKKIGKNGKAVENGPFKFVWANQWEPSTKTQHAFDCYNMHFPNENNTNNDDSPDFIDEGIELKLTPVKKNNDETFSSKERLVLNMLNYCDEL